MVRMAVAESTGTQSSVFALNSETDVAVSTVLVLGSLLLQAAKKAATQKAMVLFFIAKKFRNRMYGNWLECRARCFRQIRNAIGCDTKKTLQMTVGTTTHTLFL